MIWGLSSEVNRHVIAVTRRALGFFGRSVASVHMLPHFVLRPFCQVLSLVVFSSQMQAGRRCGGLVLRVCGVSSKVAYWSRVHA